MLLREIAGRICKIDFAALPPQAVETARNAILDTIGVTIAGAHAEATLPLHRALMSMAGPGRALVFGGDRHTDVLTAALINGTASHALDFDDCSNTLGGHPSAPIIPALLALAEERGLGGQAFVTAYVAGVELETKLGRAVNFHHYEKGWHPTATLGTFGSAAACGHLLGLGPDQLGHALALASSMASGLKANFGTMTKPFHVGHAARNGLLAALLAENGMTANMGALEDPQGFLAVYNGAGTFAAERILAEWADPFDVIEPGIAFKRHPCCASTHPAIDAMLQLRADHGLTADNVALVESWTHPRRLRHTNRPDPKTGLDGKFSVQYVLARALSEGISRLDHFSDQAVNEPAIRAIMSRVRAAPDPDATMDTAEHFYARVRVTLHSGEKHEMFVDRPVGRDRDHPMPPGALEAKFRDCVAPTMTEEASVQLLRMLMQIENVAAMSAVTDVILTGTARVTCLPSQSRNVGAA
ncbi:MmgE/PrpD family protein [Microvirga antarctica]|uniref:MmgE/PrpD family protein n=1 Tax=Microvirga antarctica TaxID=2819233 RepID=UPI001B303570|nr:MmgE/PrpD family protein [Microvirga antarctica]